MDYSKLTSENYHLILYVNDNNLDNEASMINADQESVTLVINVADYIAIKTIAVGKPTK